MTVADHREQEHVAIGTGERSPRSSSGLWTGRTPSEIVANPEFLREGHAVHDFLIRTLVVGANDPSDARAWPSSSRRLAPRSWRRTSRTAEMIKYVSNSTWRRAHPLRDGLRDSAKRRDTSIASSRAWHGPSHRQWVLLAPESGRRAAACRRIWRRSASPARPSAFATPVSARVDAVNRSRPSEVIRRRVTISARSRGPGSVAGVPPSRALARTCAIPRHCHHRFSS